MQPSEVPRAVAATTSVAAELGLIVDDAIVLHASNRIAVRLLPCDVLARTVLAAPLEADAWRAREGLFQPGPAFEVEVARQLAESDCPVAGLEPRVEPRVYVRNGFAVTLWTHHEAVPPRDIAPGEYAQALEHLHAGMRPLDATAPHFTDRVAEAQWLVASRSHTPELAEGDRQFLATALQSLRRTIVARDADEQLLHGEPHPGNLLRTNQGLLFIDLETCCRGPVEFDVAHAPEEVGEHYQTVDQDLLRECRMLVLAMITAWRWDRNDRLPNGADLAREWLSQLRADVDAYPLDRGCEA
jgi:hypothetical protein